MTPGKGAGKESSLQWEEGQGWTRLVLLTCDSATPTIRKKTTKKTPHGKSCESKKKGELWGFCLENQGDGLQEIKTHHEEDEKLEYV